MKTKKQKVVKDTLSKRVKRIEKILDVVMVNAHGLGDEELRKGYFKGNYMKSIVSK